MSSDESSSPDYWNEFLDHDWQESSPPTQWQAKALKHFLRDQHIIGQRGRQTGRSAVRDAMINHIRRMESEGR